MSNSVTSLAFPAGVLRLHCFETSLEASYFPLSNHVGLGPFPLCLRDGFSAFFLFPFFFFPFFAKLKCQNANEQASERYYGLWSILSWNL